MAALLAFGGGCASGPRRQVHDALSVQDVPRALAAYDAFERSDGVDPELLGAMAGEVLFAQACTETEAALSSESRAALLQLRLAGTPAEPYLLRIDERCPLQAQAEALSIRAARGDADAAALLAGLGDASQLEVRALSVQGLAASDGERLRALLGDVAPELRRAALSRVRALVAQWQAPESWVAALLPIARNDPSEAVRRTAVGALGAFGANLESTERGAILEALGSRLGDADAGVRFAAARGLVRMEDSEAAQQWLASLLSAAPSRVGIEGARLLVLETESEAALRYLRGALLSPEPSLRGQAALALASLPQASPASITSDVAVLTQALSEETNAAAKLSMARALLRRSDVLAAEQALKELAQGPHSMPALQAALMLLGRDDEVAIAALQASVESSRPSLLRRTAARGLARDALRPEAVRHLLTDEDAMVRVFAAGGILAAAGH